MNARSCLRDLRLEDLHRVRPCHDGDDDDYVLRLQNCRDHYAGRHFDFPDNHRVDRCDCSDPDNADCCYRADHDRCADPDHRGRHDHRDQYVRLQPEPIRHPLIRQQLIRLCERVQLPIRQAVRRQHQE